MTLEQLNLMDVTMAKMYNIPLVPLTGSLTVKALDGMGREENHTTHHSPSNVHRHLTY